MGRVVPQVIGAFGQQTDEVSEQVRLRDRLQVVRGEDGKARAVTRGAVSLPPFPAKEKWTAQDAARMRHLMVGFFPSPQGIAAMDIMTSVMWKKGDQSRTNPMPGGVLATMMRATWQSPDFSVVFAEDDFAAMMTAAAISAPSGVTLHPDELLSEHGVVFFRSVLDLNDEIIWHDTIDPIRAVSWITVGYDRVFVTLWSDASDRLGVEGATLGTDVNPYLTFQVFGFVPFDVEHDGGLAFESTLLRSIMAISQSEHARRQDVKPAKPRKLRPEYRDVPVRRMYLSSPEFGEAELAGARGKPHRLHWVRGHWRNQWFPKLEDHRTIWIDGHPRGNAALGKVGGDKVYVALAPKESS